MKLKLISLAVLSCLLAPASASAYLSALRIQADGFTPIDSLVEVDGSRYLVEPSDLTSMGFDTSRLNSVNGKFDLIQIGTIKLDEQNSTLLIDTRPDLLPRTQIDMRSSDIFMDPSKPEGTFLNYDLRAESGDNKSLAGLVEGNSFIEEVRLNALAFIRTGEALQRLSLSASQEDAATATVWSVGDGYSMGGAGVAPVRFIGAQYRKDFSLQPGFITSPTLNLSSTAAAPSTVDVIVGNQVVRSQKVPAGPFDILNVQPTIGVGGVFAVVTDPFGLQSAVGVDVTGNPNLLAQDVVDFSVQGGAIRPTLSSTESPFVSGFYRKGINNNVTVEGNAELSQAGSTLPGVRHIGASIVGATPYGNLTASGRVGTGSTVTIGYQNAWKNDWDFVLSSSVTKNSDGYAQLGGGLVSPLSISVSGSFHVDRMTLTGMHSVSFDQRFTAASLVYSPARVDEITWSANLNHLSGSVSSTSMSINASIPLDRRYSLPNRSHSASASAGSVSQSVDYLNRTNDTTGTSVRARLENGNSHKREEGSLDYRDYKFDAGMSVSAVQHPITNQTAAMAYIKGALVLDNRKVLPTRWIESGYAVVDTKIENAHILVNGSRESITNQDGKAVVSGFPPFLKTKIEVDSKDLPDHFDSASVEVSTYRKAGTSVVFRNQSMAMVQIPGQRSGVLTVNDIDYPVTDRGAYVELPPGEYLGMANGKKVSFTIDDSNELQTVTTSQINIKLGLYK